MQIKTSMTSTREVNDLADFKQFLSTGAIESAKCLLANKQEVYAKYVSKGQINFEHLPSDKFATTLIPQDVGQGKSMVALKATGNGDCLFNAGSILVCGDESLTRTLRLLVAGELYFNATFYCRPRGVQLHS